METIAGAVAWTPWWIWLTLVYLLMIGWLRSRVQVMPVGRLFVLPGLIVLVAVHGLVDDFDGQTLRLEVWGGAFAAGLAAGWLLVLAMMTVRADKDRRHVELPGTWTNVIALLLVFAVKYYFDYREAMDPESLMTGPAIELKLAATAAIAGYFLGRAAGYYHKYRTTPHSAFGRPG